MIKKFLLDHPQLNPLNYSAEKIIRLTTSSLRSKPTFLIVGVQKCGTSIVYDYICQHPKIKQAYAKKIEQIFGKYTEEITYHASNYPILKSDEITGDVRQDYSFQPNAAKNLKKILPNVKPIFIIRDPVQRTISHYNMNKRANREILSIEKALEAEDERISGEWEKIMNKPNHNRRILWNYSYKAKSIYANYIPKWLEIFPDTLILKFEEFLEDPQKILSKIFSFLKVKDYQIKIESYKYSIRKNQELEDFFSPLNKKLNEILGKEFY